MCWSLLTYGRRSLVGVISSCLPLKQLILTVGYMVLDISSLVRIFVIRVLIRAVLVIISYLTNEYSEGYSSVSSIEGGFNLMDGQ